MNQGVKTIWIVDDDKIYRFTLEKYIQMMGLQIEIKAFDDGEEALIYFSENLQNEENLPEIILLDVNMPIMDGWDFIDEYRKVAHQVNKEISVYLVSSSVDERDESRAKEYDLVADYIVKPISEDRLKQLILR